MTPKQILVTVDCDMGRLYGKLTDAIEYLQEIHAKYPEAELEEHWTSYEDMEMRFVWYRDETADEKSERLNIERREAEAAAKLKAARDAQEKRRAEWLKLNKEFG